MPWQAGKLGIVASCLSTHHSRQSGVPSADIIWSSELQTVNWNVANTQNSPISCTKVDILLSTDGGNNFDINLASQVDNTGDFEVTVPDITSSNSRIKLTCSDNIFFAINNGNFTVDVQSTPVTPPVITGQNSISFEKKKSHVSLIVDGNKIIRIPGNDNQASIIADNPIP